MSRRNSRSASNRSHSKEAPPPRVECASASVSLSSTALSSASFALVSFKGRSAIFPDAAEF
jgi:hypothetical protein